MRTRGRLRARRPWAGASAALLAATLAAQALALATGAAPAAAAQDVVFATWNVCKTTCAAPAPSWEERRLAVARVITEMGLDVVGVQEATNYAVANARTQWDDIRQLVGPAGYASPVFPASENDCRRPRDARGELSGPSPCKNTAGLLFRVATIGQAASPNGTPTAGITTTGAIAAVPGDAGRRSVMWAYLQGRASTRPFLAVSLHADTGKDQATENARMALGRGMAAWVAAMNAGHGFPGAPVVLMADLNSYAKRQPDGAQSQLRATGWTDAFTAPTRRNIEYSTINYNPALVDGFGFPSRPYVFRPSQRNALGAATRIDYIFTIGGTPLDYEVVIRLNPDGTFDERYRGSDHQMVRATIRMP